ncbi:unnamed protein product [Discosporangium mesarthrocarpum]
MWTKVGDSIHCGPCPTKTFRVSMPGCLPFGGVFPSSRSAVKDGCTHVLVLATRPEGREVLGKKPGIYETRIASKFFQQHAEPAATSAVRDHMVELRHLRTYAEDMLTLAESMRSHGSIAVPGEKGREAFMLALAPKAQSKEVGQLEMDRRVVLQGCRDGFAACYDIFVGEEGEEEFHRSLPRGTAATKRKAGERRNTGQEAAMAYFPDSLLDTPADLAGMYCEPGHLIRNDTANRNV